jgi:hypothetical protein
MGVDRGMSNRSDERGYIFIRSADLLSQLGTTAPQVSPSLSGWTTLPLAATARTAATISRLRAGRRWRSTNNTGAPGGPTINHLIAQEYVRPPLAGKAEGKVGRGRALHE